MSQSSVTAESEEVPLPAPAPKSHPRATWFLVWGEFAERSSFYGMKVILILYMINELHFEEGVASRWINLFKGVCYCLPLVGGFLADRYLGKFRTIILFSLPYILGHVIIGFQSTPCLLVALALMAMGVGAIKPNLSTLMGLTYDQQRPGQTQLRSDAFAMFYVAINAGGFISSLFVPVIRNACGYRIAFLFPAGLMVIAFVLFALGKPYYAKETVGPRRAESHGAESQGSHLAVLWRLFGLFFLVIFFWSVLEQYDNTWVLFARNHINLDIFNFADGTWQAGLLTFLHAHTGLDLLRKPVEADQFQVLNLMLIIVLVPAGALVWHLLAKCGIVLRATDKMLIGYLLTIATPAIMAVAAVRAGDAGRVSAWWIFAAYFTVTLAEVCISVTGLELAFTAAPNSMKGFITACWLAAMACGEFLNSFVSPCYESTVVLFRRPIVLSPTLYFGLFTVAMVPVTIAFVVVARRFNGTPSK